jgi:hypothetical protein
MNDTSNERKEMCDALTWNFSDLQQIQSYITLIQKDAYPRNRMHSSDDVTISAAEAIDLSLAEEMSSLRTAIPLRHIYRKMGFDEKRVQKFRVDHKLIQALILKQYCGDAVPVTCGLNALLLSGEYSCLDNLLRQDLTPNLMLKKTLGYGSSPVRDYDYDRAIITNAINLLKSGDLTTITIEEEQFIIQHRVSIEMEFRVHTLEDKVIDGMTSRKMLVSDIAKYRDYAKNHSYAKECEEEANAFVRSMLEHLPFALVAETLCGWDVVRSVEGEWKIIEINYAGFHPVFERGFHCSAYFQDSNWGFVRIAGLIHFIEKTYSKQIAILTDPCPNHSMADLYWWIGRALEFLRERDRLMEIISTVEGSPVPARDIDAEEIATEGIIEFKRYALQLESLLAVVRRVFARV